MVEATSKRPLTQLNHDIEQAETELARLEAERKVIAKDVARAKRKLRRLQFAKQLRKPSASIEIWPLLVQIVGPGVVGVFVFVLLHLLFDSFAVALLGLLAGAAAAFAMLSSLLKQPADTLLPAASVEAESQCRLADARIKEKIERITETKDRLQRLFDERRDQIASGKLQKAALLQRNWKTMRNAEWEDFVVEVCRTLGATVERSNSVAGESANLVVDFGSRRVAILTHGAEHVVNSDTIRHALSAREQLGCDSCAVLINRRFTGAAQDFAHRNDCAAIGATEFPDFVLRKVEI
jgi:hypothetical protein